MNNLQVIENNGVRVLTTKQLAVIYQTEENNIKNNFNRNIDRFIKNRDYFFLEGTELKAFKSQVTIGDLAHKFASSLYLWTERGANRHCKILDTDNAWEQFDIIEETYFRAKQNQFKLPTNYVEALESLLTSEKEKQKALEERDYAIKTKAWISDSKTATAMGKLGNAVKKINKLEIELDDSKQYASIKKMEVQCKKRFNWKVLKDYSILNKIPIKKTFDSNYGEVNTYRNDVWQGVYGVNIQ